MKFQITPNLWLQLPQSVRVKVAHELGVARSVPTEVLSGPSGMTVICDGHSAADLQHITQERMVAFLDPSGEKKLSNVDSFQLFRLVAEVCGLPPDTATEVKPLVATSTAEVAPALTPESAAASQSLDALDKIVVPEGALDAAAIAEIAKPGEIKKPEEMTVEELDKKLDEILSEEVAPVIAPAPDQKPKSAKSKK